MKIFLIAGLFWGFIGSVMAKIQIGAQGSAQELYDRFDGTCPGHDVPITYEIQGQRYDGAKMWMNSTFNVKENIDGETTLLIEVTRCKSKENPDTCEPFHSLKTNKYCVMVQASAGVWNPYFSTFRPPWKCPFKKGIYRGTDSVIDVRAFVLLASGDWYWKLNAEIRQKRNNRMLFCIFVEASVS